MGYKTLLAANRRILTTKEGFRTRSNCALSTTAFRGILKSMHGLQLNKKDQEALAGRGVSALILFGSHAQGIAGSRSDVDIGVLVKDPRVLYDRPQRNALYDALYDVLEPMVGRTVRRLCNIDIVFLQDETVNLQLKYHVGKHGIPLYEDTPKPFADFKEYVMERYADYAPLRHMFNEAILARI